MGYAAHLPLANATGSITVTNKHNQTCHFTATKAWCNGYCDFASNIQLGMAYKDKETGKWVYPSSGKIKLDGWLCVGDVSVSCDDGKSFSWNYGGVIPICYDAYIDIDFGCCK